MSLVVIVNNGNDMVIATDKRIINTNNGVAIEFTDNNVKRFITPQGYVVTYNGDIEQGKVSIPVMLKDFIENAKDYLTIDEFISKLQEYIGKRLIHYGLHSIEADIQVSGFNGYPITKILKLVNMGIIDYNRQFILEGSTNTAQKEIETICSSEEYLSGEYDMSVSNMISLARRLILESSKKETGKFGICPVSSECDIVTIQKGKVNIVILDKEN